MIVFKIAWRNIWRNKLRSITVITAILLGIWATLFVVGLSMGLNEQRTRDFISTSLAHIQVHNPKFLEESKKDNYIKNAQSLLAQLQKDTAVEGASARMIVQGMLSSANKSVGVKIIGIDTTQEKQVSTLYQKVDTGQYLGGLKRNPILIGQKLADELHVRVRSKLVLRFQNYAGDITAASFRVAGIFSSGNSQLDKSQIYVRQNDLSRLLGESHVHEIALLTKSASYATSYAQSLQKAHPNHSIRPWNEISPSLGYADEMMRSMLYIILGITLLALAFGILNTMLMAVLERKREFGMLMAVGMNRSKLFLMVVTETVLLAFIGGPIGMLLSYTSMAYFNKQGIDLSMVADGLESFGISPVVYPELPAGFYTDVAIMVMIMAILASLYPAKKALDYKPTEAIRAI